MSKNKGLEQLELCGRVASRLPSVTGSCRFFLGPLPLPPLPLTTFWNLRGCSTLLLAPPPLVPCCPQAGSWVRLGVDNVLASPHRPATCASADSRTSMVAIGKGYYLDKRYALGSMQLRRFLVLLRAEVTWSLHFNVRKVHIEAKDFFCKECASLRCLFNCCMSMMRSS